MKILILGGGIAGVSVARTLSKWITPSIKVTLIADDDHHHPAVADHLCLPLAPLLARFGVAYRQGRVATIDTSGARITTTAGDQLSYDHVVLAVGLQPGLARIWQGRSGLYHPYSPRSRSVFRAAFRRFLEYLAADSRHRGTVRIVGGGESGVELALALGSLRNRYDHRVRQQWDVALYERGERLLPRHSLKRAAEIERRLIGFGVRPETGHEVTDAELLSWTTVRDPRQFNWTIWAGGQVAPDMFNHPVFLRDRQGRIVTDRHLRAYGQNRVWVVGDVASLPDSGTAAAARAQGRVCAANIMRSLCGEPLLDYTPVAGSLSPLAYLAPLLPISELWRLLAGSPAQCAACRS